MRARKLGRRASGLVAALAVAVGLFVGLAPSASADEAPGDAVIEGAEWN